MVKHTRQQFYRAHEKARIKRDEPNRKTEEQKRRLEREVREGKNSHDK